MSEFTIGTIEDVIAELEVEFNEIRDLTPGTATGQWSEACTGFCSMFCGTETCGTNNCTGPGCQTF